VADVTDSLVVGAGHGGFEGGVGNMDGSDQEGRQKLGSDAPSRPPLNALLVGPGCADLVAGSSAWLPVLPADS